jgi:hypothetical protein
MNSGKNWQSCNTQTFWQEKAACSHVVQIYESEAAFLDLLESFVTDGFEAGDTVILIATEQHLAELELRLLAAGTDLESLRLQNQYLTFNAEALIAKFMVNDWPDYSLFMQSISQIFDRTRKNNRPVRAFGEMVAVLWEQGKTGSTIMLEQLWNMYCEKEPFSLFCAYPKSSFPEGSEVSLQNICKHHSKVIAGKQNSPSKLLYAELVN